VVARLPIAPGATRFTWAPMASLATASAAETQAALKLDSSASTSSRFFTRFSAV
jgi:hypothetical protein